MALRVAELEALLTVNDRDLARADKNLRAKGEKIEKTPITQKVKGDEKEALASLDRVATEAKKLVSQRTIATVDANIDRATKSVDRVQARLDYLRSVETDLDVTADIARAEASLSKVSRQRDALVSARAKLEVEADTGQAESGLSRFMGRVKSIFKKEGGEAGKDAGDEIGSSLEAALTAIPVAGGIILAAVGIGKAISSNIEAGLQVEVGYDRLQALTGIDPAAALRLGRAAGEAYANAYGTSIESNLDVARLSLQFGIIDADTTTREAQQVVQSMAGISDVLGEDVRPVATAVTTILKNGLANSAQEAFDLLAAGQREGANRAEDLLDTFTEYPVVLRKLGLDGKEMLGLINQGLQAGARNSDVAADALKEFQIRATDSSVSSATGFRRLGLDAEEMTAKIAAGGASAREGLQEVLDKLRETEDPVQRNAAAVELFGTKAEDLGDALFAMDLSTAVDELNGVTGAAQRMFDTLADNDATKLEVAKRNIEVGVQAIQGALAAGFSEPLSQAAEWVSQNRGPVLQFFSDLVNGAIDFGRSLIEGIADGTEALGEFISGPGAEFVDGIAGFAGFFGADTTELRGLSDEMRGFKDATSEAADVMRTRWVSNIEDARDRFNEFGGGAIAIGYLNDASLRLADTLDRVGVAADGSTIPLEWFDKTNLSASESGRLLERQIRDSLAALNDQIDTAVAAGESQEELAGRYDTAREALVAQLEQMGLTREEAQALIDTVLQTPESASTTFSSNAPEEQAKVQALADRVTTLPDGTVVINADTEPAQRRLQALIDGYSNVTVPLRADVSGFFTSSSSRGRQGGGNFAGGGEVRGPGTTTSDSILARLSNDEHVWTAEEVRGWGGHERVRRLRALGRAGRMLDGLPGFVNGGPVQVPSSVWRQQIPSSGGDVAYMPAPSTPSATPLSIDGARITGRLELGEDGFARLVDGRIRVYDKARSQADSRGYDGGL